MTKAHKSLQFRLVLAIMLALSLAWIATLTLSYRTASASLNDQLDRELKEIANSLSQVSFASQTDITESARTIISNADGNRTEYQIWRNEQVISVSKHAPLAQLAQEQGYSQSHIDDTDWRVYALKSSDAKIMVGDDLKIRNALIQNMIWSGLWPMLIAWPLIALFIWLIVKFNLAPLEKLSHAISERGPSDLEALNVGSLSSELGTVASAVNNLFSLLKKSIEREKHFADNAAHELRTPLTAIKTLAQVALRSKSEAEREHSLNEISLSVDRTSSMITQLLALARLEPEHLAIQFSTVDVAHAAAQVIANLVPVALKKNIDIGLATDGECKIKGNLEYLYLLISNLVENAIVYSPDQTSIEVTVRKVIHQVILTIEDAGPGIPADQRQRVFERFVRLPSTRVEGSGIGLTIVKRIAEIHHASIELDAPRTHQGLVVRVHFPSL